ncbi:MAG: hypothetical protein ABWW65_02605 [Thermoprotei archaeon]
MVATEPSLVNSVVRTLSEHGLNTIVKDIMEKDLLSGKDVKTVLVRSISPNRNIIFTIRVPENPSIHCRISVYISSGYVEELAELLEDLGYIVESYENEVRASIFVDRSMLNDMVEKTLEEIMERIA